MNLKFLTILFVISILASCVKSRECVCYENIPGVTDTVPDIIYINGNKKDSKKACINLADSNEVCTLK